MSFDTQNQQPDAAPVNNPAPGIGAPAPLTPSESLAEFEAFRKQYNEEFQPRGVVEQAMVFQLASTAWRLRRLPFLESVLVGVLFQRGSAWKELDLLSRHETRLNRIFDHTLRDIETRRKAPVPKPQPKASQPAASGEAESTASADFSYQAAAPPAQSPLYSNPTAAPAAAPSPPA